MPVDIVDLSRLIGAIILLIVPGYLWSFIFLKNITRLERIVFGLVLTISMFVLAMFTIDVILGLPLTYTKTWVLYGVYTGIIFILYFISLFKIGLSTQTKQLFTKFKEFFKQPIKTIRTNKNLQILLFLTGIIIFAGFMGLLPHIKDNYYLPFHVDEWEHWCYSRTVMESGSTSFIHSYLGTGILRSLETGFHLIIASISWISGSSLVTMFVFMPAIIAVFTSLVAFNIGERSERKFGLEAALLVLLIPTTCRMMGPSFFVPVTLGLLFIAFTIWLLQQKRCEATCLLPLIIGVTFLMHPQTALAELIIIFIFALLLLVKKEYRLSLLTMAASVVPVVIVLLLATRWDGVLQGVLDVYLGGSMFLDLGLPEIWVSVEHMGIVVWVFCVIGVYFAVSKGKTVIHTIGFSAIAFIVIIALYSKFGYGVPVMYERSFMYLFLMVALIAGWGLSELRRTVMENLGRFIPKQYVTLSKHGGVIVPAVICLLLVATVVPVHMDILYYQMIAEEEFETFSWIYDNIDSYRDENHSYDKCAIDPFKASPFAAVSGLYIVSSTMSPIYGYNYHIEVEKFLNGKCTDVSFMHKHGVSVVYSSSCNNSNLTMIYPNVYLYPGLHD